MRSRRVCLAAVGTGSGLEYVPLVFRTHDMCLMALEASASALQYVPDDVIRDDVENRLWRQAVSTIDCRGHAEDTDVFRTRYLCLQAIESLGSAIL